ncbi:MAG: FkbM family methyltransferase [Candidatus Woesebacteria bacterium]|jgi:FkbM family methyltransferase
MKILKKFLYYFALIFSYQKFYKLSLILRYLSFRISGIDNYENNNISGETNFINKLKNIYKNNKLCIFDVGCNKGDYSNLLLNTFPNLKLHCFDPSKINIAKMKKRFKTKNLFLNQVAVGKENGKIIIWDYSNNEGSEHASAYKDSLLTHNSNRKIKKYTAKKITLKNYIEQNAIEKIDLLKIDVEGMEFDVLKGLGKKILKISFIQFEFNLTNAYNKVLFLDFFELLNKNFKLYRLLPNEFLPIQKYNPIEHEIYAFQNIVAVSKKLKIDIQKS